MKLIRSFVLIVLLLICSRISAYDLIVVKSEFIHQDDSVLVFSPSACHEGDIPTLFLLHGRSGKHDSWSKHMDLQKLSDSIGWRIICPDGQERSWYINCEGNRWRDFFWLELWPELDSRYQLNSDKTFITGLSMGGAGAVNIFLDHPEKFRGSGTMSGSLDFLFSTTSARKEVPVMLGDESEDFHLTNAESAVTRIRYADIQALKDKMIIISCGTGDGLLPCSKLLEDRCLDLGIPYTAIYSPGVHSWAYWTYIINKHIIIFQEMLD